MYSFADKTLAVKTMLAGLKSNGDLLAAWGFDAKFLPDLDKTYQDVLTLSAEQQALKARLKEKTAALGGQTGAMLKMQHKARRLVKAQLPRESWKEFGVTAKQ